MIQRVRRRLGRLLQGGLGARLVLDPVVTASYWWYRRTDDTPAVGYSAMRKLFGSPRAWRLDQIADRSARSHDPLDLGSSSGLIGDRPETVLATLRRDGIAVLNSRLPESACAT